MELHGATLFMIPAEELVILKTGQQFGMVIGW